MKVMKLKDNNLLTMRGKVPINTQNDRLTLFDGRFDTGFRVVSFDISADVPVATYEIMAKLRTAQGASFTGATWDWSNNEEIAWAQWGGPSSNQINYLSFVDADNLVVEDLFIEVYTTSGDIGPVNYMITLQKYDFPDWTGALAMVRNNAQSV
jgi:hypothetical protein